MMGYPPGRFLREDFHSSIYCIGRSRIYLEHVPLEGTSNKSTDNTLSSTR
jgi:hypothetical protein